MVLGCGTCEAGRGVACKRGRVWYLGVALVRQEGMGLVREGGCGTWVWHL